MLEQTGARSASKNAMSIDLVMKESVITKKNKFWTFEFGVEKRLAVLFYVTVGLWQ